MLCSCECFRVNTRHHFQTCFLVWQWSSLTVRPLMPCFWLFCICSSNCKSPGDMLARASLYLASVLWAVWNIRHSLLHILSGELWMQHVPGKDWHDMAWSCYHVRNKSWESLSRAAARSGITWSWVMVVHLNDHDMFANRSTSQGSIPLNFAAIQSANILL